MESETAALTMDVPVTHLPSTSSGGNKKNTWSSPLPLPKKPPASASPAAAAAMSAARSADAFLQRLTRCVSTRAGADTTLMAVCYAARLSGASLEHLGRAFTQQNARDLIALALKLPPQASVRFAQNPVYSPLVSFALRLAARLKNLAAVIADVRGFNRLFGLLGLYMLGRRMVIEEDKKKNKKDEKSTFDRALAVAQLVALVSFQATENVAFLAAKRVLPVRPALQLRLARWSVRSWASYVFMELGRLLLERHRALEEVGGKKARATLEWELGWQRDFFRNLAWAPLTLHWSVDDGPLNDFAIGALAMWPAAGSMRDLWRANA